MDPYQLLIGMAGQGRQQSQGGQGGQGGYGGGQGGGGGYGGGGGGQGGGGGGQSAPQFTSSSSSTSDYSITRFAKITTNDDARGLLNDMMSRELGRRAVASEVDRFQAALNLAQMNNPLVTSRYTTGTSNSNGMSQASGNSSNSSSSSSGNSYSNGGEQGGVNQGQFAQDYVIDTDPQSEYGKYQAATTYANALFQAIRSPV